jgi:transposase
MHRHDDARTLAPAAQAHVRRLAVKAVRAGLRQTAAAKTYGVSRCAVTKWMAIDKVGGLRALKPTRRGRRLGQGGRLPVTQAQRIRSLIVGTMPDQLRLPFSLWTRAAVASLIAREYGLAVSLVTVGRYLLAWGLSPQKPVRRAYERREAAFTRWLKQEYPAIARQARQEKATTSWGDEMGLRSDHVTGTSYAPVGQTPIVWATGQRFGCHMISASTNKGALAFLVFQGKFKAPVFVTFLQRLLKQIAGKISLIVDGHPVHKSGTATRFAATHSARLQLIRMPGYCPELNPDELLNQDVKTNGLGKSRPTTRAELMAIVRSHLYRRQKHPQVSTNLFREQHLRYAA